MMPEFQSRCQSKTFLSSSFTCFLIYLLVCYSFFFASTLISISFFREPQSVTHRGPDTPSVSVRQPSFCGVFCTVGSSLPMVEFFRPIQHVESAAEPVGERNHSDWWFSLNESVHKKRNGREERKPTSKAKRAHTEGSSHFSSSSHLIIPIHGYFHSDMAIWNEAKW